MREEGLAHLQEMIATAHNKGYDLPEELKDRLRANQYTRQMDIDNKMDKREKMKRKKMAEEEANQKFFEETGIRNEAEDFDMDNLIN